jgi:histidinol-phosphate aminotransferase
MKVSEEILQLIPYKPGKPIAETQRQYGISKVIKLASNENPLGMSPKAKLAVEKALQNGHRYPDASCYELVQKISKFWKVPSKNISVGNGSDELIDLLVRIYCEPREAIITSEKAFVAYTVRAGASRVKVINAPLKEKYYTDLEAIARILRTDRETKKIRLVFLPNPNNPTGTYILDSEVAKFLQEFGNHPELLIVFDEAYTEFVRAQDYQSAMELFPQYNNIVVLKTLSKIYGLAGLRIGIMIAPEQTIDLVNRVRTPFNVNELAQAAAIAALDDSEFIKKTCETTWKGLDYFYHELKALQLPFVESQGNFVLFDTLRDAGLVNEELLKRGVIMRPVGNYGLPTEMRLSVGLPEENQFAISALKEVIKIVAVIK